MTAYVIRRILWGILLLIIVCALTFVFFRVIPTGDPAVLRLLVGLSVGIVSALRRHSLLDRASMGTALVLISAPEFWLGLVVLLLFSQDIGKVTILPGSG